MKKIIAITIIILCFTIQTVYAADHYVATDGSDTWANSTNIGTPCSPTTAMTNASAGDTAYFRGGTYELYYDEEQDPSYYWYRGILEPSNSGASGNLIVFAAYPGETPIMNGHTSVVLDFTDNTRAFGSGTSDYIVFDGFTFQTDDGNKMGGLIITGHNAGGRVEGNIARNCIFNGGSTEITSTDNREGLRIEGTSNTTVRNCLFYSYNQVDENHNTSCIKTYDNDNLIIENNEFSDTTQAIYLKKSTDDSIIRYNYIHDSYDGIHTDAVLTFDSDRNKFYHNVCINNGFSAFGINNQETATVDDWEIYNNTFVNTVRGIGVARGSCNIYNNIMDDNTYNITANVDNLLTTCDHNQFGDYASNYLALVRLNDPGEETYTTLGAWQSSGELVGGGNPGTGSLVSDPVFTNGSGSLNVLSDFNLDVGSPCINTGRGGVDMGANISLVGVDADAGGISFSGANMILGSGIQWGN